MREDCKNGSGCWYSAELLQMVLCFWRWWGLLWSFGVRVFWCVTARGEEQAGRSPGLASSIPHWVTLCKACGVRFFWFYFWNLSLNPVFKIKSISVTWRWNPVPVCETATLLSTLSDGLPGVTWADPLTLLWRNLLNTQVPVCHTYLQDQGQQANGFSLFTSDQKF